MKKIILLTVIVVILNLINYFVSFEAAMITAVSLIAAEVYELTNHLKKIL